MGPIGKIDLLQFIQNRKFFFMPVGDHHSESVSAQHVFITA